LGSIVLYILLTNEALLTNRIDSKVGPFGDPYININITRAAPNLCSVYYAPGGGRLVRPT
jgi:hypothetical protein